MLFLGLLVFCFIVFVALYARYMFAENDISKRRTHLENKREKAEQKIKRLQSGTGQIKKDINSVSARLEDLKRTLREGGRTDHGF
ncbi:hypothetical protein [Maridesulfovibrio sp.]|uniref:hypothetical protein n=1 Tax=Maridesulfovibrio sp. TaxID=2795000 RepID=UPI002A1879DB|nr:hypothetical protein [Maridesulfovibrio sp.]